MWCKGHIWLPFPLQSRYGGPALKLAKAVCDAGQGGMVLLSGTTFASLRGRAGPAKPLLVFAGGWVRRAAREGMA